MITDADVKKLKKTFATKADLKNYPTHDDLSVVVAKLATKAELQEVKDDLVDVKDNTNKILISVDRISKTLEEWEYPALGPR